MGDWNTSGGAFAVTVGQNATTSTGTTVTAGGSANVKGALVALSASTPIRAGAIVVVLAPPVNSADHLVDIGVGAAGFETIIVPNILFSGRNHDYNGYYFFPIGIPLGSRIAARCQSTGANLTLTAAVILLSGGFSAPSAGGSVTTYGAVTADSGGTQVDPGGTANTKQAWSELTAATGARTRQILVGFGNVNNNVRTSQQWLIDLATGPAAQEHIIIPDLMLAASSVGDLVVPPVLGPFSVGIPAGSRLAARAQSDGTDGTDRLFDIAVYGVS